jgi:LPS O-antigen subunit length determinant protein (WzzB/FepE family)
MNSQPNTINTVVDDELSLIDIYHVVIKGKWIILLCTVIFVLMAGVYLLRAKPVYESTAVLQIGHIGLASELNGYKIRYIIDPETLSREFKTTTKEFSVKPEIDNKKNGINIITFKARKNNPKQAREVLVKITDDLVKRHDLVYEQVLNTRKDQVSSLRKRIETLRTGFNLNDRGLSNAEKLKIIEIQSDLEKQLAEEELLLTDIYHKPTRLLKAPTLNTKPVKPDKSKIIAIALILGLMAGVVIAFLIDYFQKYLPTASQKSIPK